MNHHFGIKLTGKGKDVIPTRADELAGHQALILPGAKTLKVIENRSGLGVGIGVGRFERVGSITAEAENQNKEPAGNRFHI